MTFFELGWIAVEELGWVPLNQWDEVFTVRTPAIIVSQYLA